MKKKIWIIIVILLVLVLIIPIPGRRYKDGGTKEFKALTYKIVVWNRLLGEGSTYSKTSVFWFPNNFKSIDELWELENVQNMERIDNALTTKESIVKLTNEQATNALKGKTEKEIYENWGEPDGMLSGFYGDIYICNDKQIVIYYDADSVVTDVRVFDREN